MPWRRPKIVSIYLIKIVGTDVYKIGYTSKDIRSRMRVIKYYHGPVELIDIVESGFSLESRLHQKFTDKKVNNGFREFFKLNSDDVEFVKVLFNSIRNG